MAEARLTVTVDTAPAVELTRRVHSAVTDALAAARRSSPPPSDGVPPRVVSW